MKKILTLISLLGILTACVATPPLKKENCTNTSCTLSEKNVSLHYKVEGQNLLITYIAKTTGWVAVGFGATTKMKDALIVMGYLDKNKKQETSIEYGTGTMKHSALKLSETSKKDIKNILVKSINSDETELSFTIPLKSNDAKFGKSFQSGKPMKVILAYGPNDAKNFKSYHAFRTTEEITITTPSHDGGEK